MIGRGCMIGPPAAAGKGVQLTNSVQIVSDMRLADITNGLIHKWPLNQNGNDVVGALHFSNYGGVTFSANGALFSGAQSLYATHGAQNPGTYSIWLNPSAYIGDPYLMAGLNTGSVGLWGIIASGENIRASANTTQYAQQLSGFSENAFPDEKLLTMVLGGGYVRLYVGGELVSSAAFGSVGTATSFRLGSYNNKYNFFSGTMRDARVYNRSLNASEIAVLADNGPNP